MTNRMINNRVSKLFELEAAKRELETKIDAIKQELKDNLEALGVDDIDTGKFIVRYTPVVSTRLDTARFKADNLKLFNLYSVESSYRRFSYSVH